MLNHFEHTSGSEGPDHDPYGYDEYTFTNLKGESVTLHRGLKCSFTDTKGTTNVYFGEEYNTLPVKKFEEFVGLSIRVVEKLIERTEHPSRCPKCKSKQFEDIEGYPGETFTRCAKCGEMLEYNFNVGAII